MLWTPGSIHSYYHFHIHSQDIKKNCNILLKVCILLSISAQQIWRIYRLWGRRLCCGCKCEFHLFVLLFYTVWVYFAWYFDQVFSRENSHRSWSHHQSWSASFCCVLTLSYRPCKHLTELLFWLLLLLSANAERCPDVCSVSLSAAYLLCGVRLGKTKQ